MENREYIEVYNGIGDINEEYFFIDFLSKCYEKGLLDDKGLNKIYDNRLELLKIQLKYYTKDESSSVMVELAEKILQGIDYAIGVYLKSLNNMNLMIEEVKKYCLDEMLKKGHEIIKERVINNKHLLNDINKSKLNTSNYSYTDTIDCGIPLFFNEYDEFFTPHESPGSIDYQLCIDNMNLMGIEYIEKYLSTLNLENEFCCKFNSNEIKELLNGYDLNCDLLLINIFEIVLINAVGLIICDKTLSSLNINNIDRDYIKNKLCFLTLEDLKNELQEYAYKLVKILDITNRNLISYINKAILKLTPAIKNSVELDKLEKVFISYVENDDEYIEYIDKEKMSNSKFKRITEKIRESSSVDEKITLIKNNIESLEDLIDMLDAECLFDKEFNIYFEGLSQFEIVLIFKYISDLSLDNIYDKEWYLIFNKYISKLSEKEQSSINQISEKVLLI